MKKICVLFVAILAMVVVSQAQDLVSKKGVKILPEKGNCALGIDAVPFLQYAGDLMNGTVGNAAPTFNFTAPHPMTIYAKYFLQDKTALRTMVRIGFASDTWKNYVPDQNSTDPEDTEEDQLKQKAMDIVLGVGLEKRKGVGRVQGLYGAQFNFMYASQKNTYEYGNDMDATHNNPVSTDWTAVPPAPVAMGTRVLDDKAGSEFGFGIDAVCGVEYFFAPKVSIGGEFTWGLQLASQGEGEMTTEYWDGFSSSVKETTAKTAGDSHFRLDTGNFGGAINLLFYF
jgi:hypothetical protein